MRSARKPALTAGAARRPDLELAASLRTGVMNGGHRRSLRQDDQGADHASTRTIGRSQTLALLHEGPELETNSP